MEDEEMAELAKRLAGYLSPKENAPEVAAFEA